MDACSEAEVSVGLAIEDAAIGVRELLSVTVCGGVVHQDGFTGAEAVSAELDFLCDSSRKAVNRSCEGRWPRP
jgi:hypothetical protein